MLTSNRDLSNLSLSKKKDYRYEPLILTGNVSFKLVIGFACNNSRDLKSGPQSLSHQ
jgi:hypothetical protein